ncbi:MAG: hypothetical protein HOG34_15315 [Bacteroidetes bacterium]|nr:hypothetical protein [Bacteroidota bacterium]
MEQKRIEALLQKYFKAYSSPEEELELIRYFETHEIPEEWLPAKEQLLGIHALAELDIPVPENLEADILSNLSKIQTQKSVNLFKSRPLYTLVSVAASVIIIASALIFMNRQPDLGTYSDPEMAYAETKQALELVSNYFGHGTAELANLTRIEKAVEPLSNLSKVEETKKNLQLLGHFERGVKQTRGLLSRENEQ